MPPADHSPTLLDANARWINRVRLGCQAVAATPAVGLPLMVVLAIEQAVPGPATAWGRLLGALFIVVAGVVFITGCWLILTPEPRLVVEARPRAATIARIALAVTLVGTGVAWLVYGLPGASRLWMATLLLAGPFGASMVLALDAFARHIEALARRCGNEYLPRRNRNLRRGLWGSWATFAFSLVLVDSAAPMSPLLGIPALFGLIVGAGASIVITGLLLSTSGPMILAEIRSLELARRTTRRVNGRQ